MKDETKPDLDLGDSHWLTWFVDGEGTRVGAMVDHKKQDGSECPGAIHFKQTAWERDNAGKLTEEEKARPLWTFDGNFDAPTFSPSLLCTRCGDHGFIRQGKWVRA